MSSKNQLYEIKKRIALKENEPWYCTKEVDDCVNDIPMEDIIEKKCHKYYTKKNNKIKVCRNRKFPKILRTCSNSAWSSNKILKDMCKERVLPNMVIPQREYSIRRRSSGTRSSGRKSSGRMNNARRSSSVRRSESRKANARRKSSSTRRFEDLMKQNEEAFNRMNNR